MTQDTDDSGGRSKRTKWGGLFAGTAWMKGIERAGLLPFISGGARKVASAISLNVENDSGQWRASARLIGEKSSLSTARTKRVLAELRTAGLIGRSGDGGSARTEAGLLWVVPPAEFPADCAARLHSVAQHEREKRNSRRPKRVSTPERGATGSAALSDDGGATGSAGVRGSAINTPGVAPIAPTGVAPSLPIPICASPNSNAISATAKSRRAVADSYSLEAVWSLLSQEHRAVAIHLRDCWGFDADKWIGVVLAKWPEVIRGDLIEVSRLVHFEKCAGPQFRFKCLKAQLPRVIEARKRIAIEQEARPPGESKQIVESLAKIANSLMSKSAAPEDEAQAFQNSKLRTIRALEQRPQRKVAPASLPPALPEPSPGGGNAPTPSIDAAPVSLIGTAANPTFDDFWQAFPGKRRARELCQQFWDGQGLDRISDQALRDLATDVAAGLVTEDVSARNWLRRRYAPPIARETA